MLLRYWTNTLLVSFGIIALSTAQAHETLSEATAVHKIVILPSYAQIHRPEAAPEHLAFAPDNQSLAYTTHKLMSVNEEGEFWASQLHLLPLHPMRSAQTLVDAESTAKFGFYGAPALHLAWQQNDIQFIISNGDDTATEIRYLVKEQRLANPNIGATTIDEPISPSAEQTIVAKCLPQITQDQISALNVSWLKTNETALYQLNYAKTSEDIALLNVKTCQQQLLAVPKYQADEEGNTDVEDNAGKEHNTDKAHKTSGIELSYRLIGGVQQDAQLILMLESRVTAQRYNQKHRSKTLILQTNIHTLGSPNLSWQNWSYGLGGDHHVEVLSKQPNKVLFMLKPNQDCAAQLFSLSEQQLTGFMVDNFKLCAAAVGSDGQLALNLKARRPQTIVHQNDKKRVNHDAREQSSQHNLQNSANSHSQQIWLVEADFLNHLVK